MDFLLNPMQILIQLMDDPHVLLTFKGQYWVSPII